MNTREMIQLLEERYSLAEFVDVYGIEWSEVVDTPLIDVIEDNRKRIEQMEF